MNVKQAAAILYINPETVKRFIRSGLIKAEKHGSSHAWDVKLKKNHYVTTKAIANDMHVTTRWVRYLIKKKAVKFKRVGRAYRIPILESFKLSILYLSLNEAIKKDKKSKMGMEWYGNH